MALATWSVNDPSFTYATSQPVTNFLGAPGAAAADLLMQVFGLASLAIVAILVVLAVRFLAKQPLAGWRWRILTMMLAIGSASAFASAIPQTESWPLRPIGLGGFIGDAVLGVPAFIIGGLGGISRAFAALTFGVATILFISYATAMRGEAAADVPPVRRDTANRKPPPRTRMRMTSPDSPCSRSARPQALWAAQRRRARLPEEPPAPAPRPERPEA